MRLWHKDLISVLPRQQLLGQWRELALIAKDIIETGKTNHILINKIMDYPLVHFRNYSLLIHNEMVRRGYRIDKKVKDKMFSVSDYNKIEIDKLYSDWHNERYLKQCLSNLEEKYDCGGVSEDEWEMVKSIYSEEVLA